MNDRLVVNLDPPRFLVHPVTGNKTSVEVQAVCHAWEVNSFTAWLWKLDDRGYPTGMIQLRVNTLPRRRRGGMWFLKVVQILEKKDNKDVGVTADRINRWILGDDCVLLKRDKHSLINQVRKILEYELLDAPTITSELASPTVPPG